MLTLHTHTDFHTVLQYFKESYTDYYAAAGHSEKDTPATWHGKTADRLGLTGAVERKAFTRLLKNIHPFTGQRLTLRTKKNRRLATDLTLSAPKSVSLLALLTQDQRIIKVFKRANALTMKEVEKDIQTRVRKSNADGNRTTGNIIYLSAIHKTARPVKGEEDPHLHAHNLIANITWDDQEQAFKAIQNETLYFNQAYYRMLFDNYLAYGLNKIGYEIERTDTSFEIKGFEKSLTDKFSSRTQTINKRALQLGITDPKAKGELGAKTRESKQNNFSLSQLREIWVNRLLPKEKEIIDQANRSKTSNKNQAQDKGEQKASEARSARASAARALRAKEKRNSDFKAAREDFNHWSSKDASANKNTPPAPAFAALHTALSHLLERRSVVEKLELITTALYYGMGKITLSGITLAMESDKDLIRRNLNGHPHYTTKTRLSEEDQLSNLIASGINTLPPLDPDYRPENKDLTKEQRTAVRHMLRSPDFVTVMIGDAGTGKTFTLKEVQNACIRLNIPFRAFAPTASASRGTQRQDGFKQADTIARLLKEKRLQESCRNGVIWIDEAGLLSLPQTLKLLQLAKSLKARVLLTGDSKQHGSVEHTDTLRLILQIAALKPARLTKVFRQKVKPYRKAVETLAAGNISKAFNALQNMNAIHEHDDVEKAIQAAARDYIRSEDNQDTLLIATTHKQGQRVSALIRKYLKATGRIAAKGKYVQTLSALDKTLTQKQDPRSYRQGQVIEFHSKAGTIKAKQRFTVIGQDQYGYGQVMISDEHGIIRPLPLHLSALYTVFEKVNLELATGDKIRITQNSVSAEGIMINNGAILTVKGMNKKGFVLSDGKNILTLEADFQHFQHGYYTSSPASQGRTVDKVILLATSTSGRAASKEQFYVSTTRGKFNMAVHTDDVRRLKDAFERSSHRMAASELMQKAASYDEPEFMTG